MDSLISWTAKDRKRLDSAVNKFNREVNKLSKMNIDVPDKKSFTDIVQHISTRRELDNVINAMNKFNERTATTEIALSSGEKVSLYEYEDVARRSEQAQKNLYIELQKIQNERQRTQNAYMGETRVNEIEDLLQIVSEYTDTKEKFQKASMRTNFIGRTDYEFAKQKLFRENFMKSLENVQNFDHYKLLKETLNKYRNPSKFYEFVKNSNIMMDIFIWYNSTDAYTTYGKFDSPNEMFDYGLTEELGIKI